LSRATLVARGLITAALVAVLGVSAATPSSVAKTRHRAQQPGHFTVSSFNVLGASHTPAGGRRATGATRIGWASRLLTRHHVDVVGFQELQTSQLTTFLSLTDGAWALYPGLDGRRRIDGENSVGWRTDRFELVQATTVDIPYFNGHPRAMPVVLLRDRSSGMLAYFANFHNPADTPRYRNQAKWRLAATEVEIALQRRLARTGIPRIMTGDMNDRAPYFCRVTAGAPLKAARPTSVRRHGVCSAGKPRAVDWILGSHRITFSGYVEDRGALVARTTDHPVIVSDVTVDPAKLPDAWGATPRALVLAGLGG
jgi:Endonuclease/Exonuclease/phosphatase family